MQLFTDLFLDNYSKVAVYPTEHLPLVKGTLMSQ